MIARNPKRKKEAKAAKFMNGAGKKAEAPSIAVLLKMRPDVFERVTAQAEELGMRRTAYIISTVVADMNRRERGE